MVSTEEISEMKSQNGGISEAEYESETLSDNLCEIRRIKRAYLNCLLYVIYLSLMIFIMLCL